MLNNHSINFNPELYEHQFQRAIDAHIANAKSVLRAIESGSLLQQANAPRPGALVHLGVGQAGISERDLVAQACSSCFRSIIAEFLVFLDRQLACERVFEHGPYHFDENVSDVAAALEFARDQLEQTYVAVAADRSLTSPRKIKALIKRADSARIAQSFVDVRNCLEHGSGIPKTTLVMWFRRMSVSTGGEEIRSFPHDVKEGKLTLSMELQSQEFCAGKRIVLTEADVENVWLTVRFLAREALADAGQEKGSP